MVSECCLLLFSYLICLSGFHMLSSVFKNNPPLMCYNIRVLLLCML